MYAMPFNTSGPVLFYNKNAFRKAGLDPDKPPTTLDEVRAAAEKLKSSGAVKNARPGPQGRSRVLRAVARAGGEALREQQQRAQGTRDEGRLQRRHPVVEIFTWMSEHGEGRPRRDQPRQWHQPFDDLLGIGNGNHAMAIDTSAALGTIETGARRPVSTPTSRLGRRTDARPRRATAAVSVQGGELFIVNKSAPEKQAAAWQYLKFLDTPESQATWAVGTGYLPIVKKAAASSAGSATSGRRAPATRWPTTSCSRAATTRRPPER